MIEGSIITLLRSDTSISSRVANYGAGTPAIFSDEAPEDAVKPYLVIRIEDSTPDHKSIDVFTIFIDYFEYNNSRSNARHLMRDVTNFLDDKVIKTDSNYDTIRIEYFSGSPIIEQDARDIHHNLQFTARAGRKAWMAQL